MLCLGAALAVISSLVTAYSVGINKLFAVKSCTVHVNEMHVARLNPEGSEGYYYESDGVIFCFWIKIVLINVESISKL